MILAGIVIIGALDRIIHPRQHPIEPIAVLPADQSKSIEDISSAESDLKAPDDRPKMQPLVVDRARLLSRAALDEIHGYQVEAQKRYHVPIYVATIEEMKTGAGSIQNYGYQWFKDNALEDNAVLILVSLYDRVARIQFGPKHNQRNADRHASQVMSEVLIPAFKRGDYANGITSAVATLSQRDLGNLPSLGGLSFKRHIFDLWLWGLHHEDQNFF